MRLESVLHKIKTHTPTILGSGSFSKYAVLLPLIEKADSIHVLFEIRSLELRRQPGEICFPGGRIDPSDQDEKGAAIRETIEELGLKQGDITDVYPLDYLISPFGMIVYPYIGLIKSSQELKPNPSEVGDIFTVPLSFLLKTDPKIYQVNFRAEPEDDFPFELIVGGENYNWRTRQLEEYFYIYENRVIWGMTARILAHFIEILKQNTIDSPKLGREKNI
ncbi:coenzyme A pyrophosphatase [Bacillus sp. M6-12]|uniref:NUDIX hydrolase n=1 Tax=Bacillus sp. M6-12 TaxID=2054166 RepID=UPI000C760B36|nr:CoA pyrophosphatase [Bacillus sp. M6-12]PLS18256.1 coenzyme A pyrophosphatase [Bacillus sp. M6-12]